jgi:protease-4
MNQFFKFFFASCLGFFVAVALLVGLTSAVIMGIANQANKPKAVKPNSVLHLTFDDPIPEQTNNLQFDPYNIQQSNVLGLHAVIDALERAKADDDIKGVFIEMDGLSATKMGMANTTVLRDALIDFKEDGKFIIAYSKYYSQGAYYLSTVSDKLYVNPLGMVDFRGFSTQIPFFKDMLDRVGVDMQVFYAGKFKSATEPYRFNEMSEENRLQVREYLNETFDLFLQEISESRQLDVQTLKSLADQYTGLDPQAAATSGLVDQVGYRDEVINDIREKLGLEEGDDIPLVKLNTYDQANPGDKNYSIKDKIAIIYAEGTIVDGKGEAGSIGDEKYTEYVRKARKDKKVKAIVLRVNSPGGSAMSSENIWRELSLAKSEGKPVVVSMGDYAASGGYYISAMADSIFAEPNTITGSIGVFMIIPNASTLMDDKLGIHFDSVKTNTYATGITPFYPLSSSEQLKMQQRTDELYEIFLQRVAEGRGMSRDEAHAIAQGRVWTGQKAKELGLVDRLGGLEQAVAAAAELADLDKYRTTAYPKVKDPIQQILDQWVEGSSMKASVLAKSQLKPYIDRINFIQEIQGVGNVQARMPFFIPFE